MELYSNHLKTILEFYESRNVEFIIVSNYVDKEGLGHFQVEYKLCLDNGNIEEFFEDISIMYKHDSKDVVVINWTDKKGEF